ncbi:MAG: hypothetical protein NZ695_06210 [Dehalococcoidia bacterium]|nr:hypothetical protein [Dehalococcoidia bacterium]MDW8008776.1 hypothetical protein [Chloroflexota bacterium]
MRRRWFRFGFYAPFGFWLRGFHGAWGGPWHRHGHRPFSLLRDYRRWLEEYHQDLRQAKQELEEELKEVEAELERLRGARKEEERQGP